MRPALVALTVVAAAAACGETLTPAVPPADPVAVELERTKKELAAARAEIERLQERQAVLDDVEPVAAIVHSIRDLPWKLRTAARLTEAQRTQFAMELGRDLQLRPDRVDEVVRSLRGEEDPAALRVLAEAIRGGALASARGAERSALADVLRDGEPAARRLGAAWAMLPGAEPTPAEARAAAASRLRFEEDPEVIGALAEVVGDAAGPEAVEALRAAAARMPPGEDRRRALTTVARASLARDRGDSAAAAVLAAAPGALRDDLAAGLARAAISTSASMRRAEPPEKREERMKAALERFLAVYRGVGDLAVRTDLVRAAVAGLDVMPTIGPPPEERAAFYRAVAAAEPDAAQRARLERLAAAFEGGTLSPTSPDVDAILSGRR